MRHVQGTCRLSPHCCAAAGMTTAVLQLQGKITNRRRLAQIKRPFRPSLLNTAVFAGFRNAQIQVSINVIYQAQSINYSADLFCQKE
ncbi:MAG TPA: hypothetical protein PKA77_12890 [Chitinophagaceae bacterium]|jgi:hypothetical protein|nr:hypothetical protein [Chitinophagaceae bacterium]